MAIEGIDGSGKTTQAKMLVERLNKKGYKAIYVQPIYVLLNLIPLEDKDKKSFSPRRAHVSEISNKKSSTMRRALMGLSGYMYALTTYMFIKFLCKNKINVCDRYFYQFFFDLFGDWCESIIKIFPKPDIAFFLDGDLDLFYLRMDSPSDTNVGCNYYLDVIKVYRKISQKYGIIQVDANLNKEAINDVIFRYLTKKNMKGLCYE